MKKIIFLLLITLVSISCNSKEEAELVITPIQHGTAAFTYGDVTVFVDPTGNAETFSNFSLPNYIFITEIVIINNGEEKTFGLIKAEAIPMYNLREEALKFHTKGRGNGYVFTVNKQRIYFSGDTEDIPEMRALKNIDKAYVCMNLPYTMTVESAADAVLAFKPKEVYPYHYRGTGGLSDVAKFKSLVNTGNNNIKVVQLNWYPNQK